MVISQIAGLATAFGTGELSGAGFGPNYTILMKLGYEFYAPRILEEMEKNPNVFFQDTLWFQKFQKQIKLYSDKVLEQTLDTLLHIPQQTLDAIEAKFGAQQNTLIPLFRDSDQEQALPINPPPSGDPWEGWNNFWNAMAKRIPNVPSVLAEDTPFISTGSGETTIQGSLISLSRIQLQRWRFIDLNNAMSAITKNNSPYDGVTQGIIRDLWNKARNKISQGRDEKRQQEITSFKEVTIPISNIPERSSIRPAGQSVKLERNKLIKEIAAKARQLRFFQQRSLTSPNRNKLILTAIRQLKLLQQKLNFLLRNYTF